MMGAHFVHGFDIDQDALAVFQTNLEGEESYSIEFRLIFFPEDFEMDNVDLVNIDVSDLGPDWKHRSGLHFKNQMILHLCFFRI